MVLKFDTSAFIDVLGWNLKEETNQQYTIPVLYVKKLQSAFDQNLVDHLVEEIDVNTFDALAIPGGFKDYDYYKDAYEPSFLNLIQRLMIKINGLHQFV